jgi:hypothetical protein
LEDTKLLEITIGFVKIYSTTANLLFNEGRRKTKKKRKRNERKIE